MHTGGLPHIAWLEKQLDELESDQGGSPQKVFDMLVGPRQLWWKCCQEAAREDPGWLFEPRTERVRRQVCKSAVSGGNAAADSMAAVANSVFEVARALSAPPDQAHEQAGPLTRIAQQWDGSALLISSQPPGTGPVTGRGVPTLEEGLAHRLESVITALQPSVGDVVTASPAARAMVEITARLLASAERRKRPVARVSVVFGSPGEGAEGESGKEQGVAGFLELREFPAGPPGLFPDPQAMAGARSNGPAFANSLSHAWQSCPGGRCVLWRIILPDDPSAIPPIQGGSLGLAFALALRALFRYPASRRPTLAWLRGIFYSLRPKTAVTGGIDERGQPQLVTDMGGKLHAAHWKRWRLVAPEANRADIRQAPDPAMVKFAATIKQADRYARQWRTGRLATAAALIATATTTGLVISHREATAIGQQAATRTSQNLGQYLVSQMNATSLSSASLGPVPPETDGLLAVDAYRIEPTQQADQALFDSYAQLSPYQALIGSYPGDNETVSVNRDGTVAAVSQSTSVDVWQIPDQLSRRHLIRRMSGLKGATVSPDGARIAATGNGMIQLWQTYPLRRLREIPIPIGSIGVQFTAAPVLAFSTSDRYLGILTGAFSLFIWNLDSGHLMQMQVPPSAAEPFSSIGFTGNTIYAEEQGGNVTYVWNLVTGKVTDRRKGARPALAGENQAVSADCVSGISQSHWVFTETATGQPTLGLPSDLPCYSGSTAEALNGNFLATVRLEDSLRSAPANQALIASVINLRTHKTVAEAGLPQGSSIVAISPSGRRMFIQGASFGIARLTPPGGPHAHVDSTAGYVTATSPNGRFVAEPIQPGATPSAGASPQVRIISSATDAVLHTLVLPVGNNSPNSFDIGGIDDLAFLPDGTLLALAAGEISLWNVGSGAMVSTPVTLRSGLDTSSVPGPEIAVDHAAADEIAIVGPGNNTIELWQAGTWRLLRVIGPVSGSVYSITFSPQGGSIAITTDGGLADVFSTVDGSRLASMPLPGGPSDTSLVALAHGYVALVSLSALSIWHYNSQVARLNAPTGLLFALLGTGDAGSHLIIGLNYASETAASSISEPIEISPDPAAWASTLCTVIARGLTAQELAIPGPGIPNKGC